MTDYTKLIERLHASLCPNKLEAEVKEAIEALRGEVARLKGLSVTVNVKRLIARKEQAEAERDALQAKISALHTQEPVSYGDAARRRGKQIGALWQFDDLGLSMFVGEIIGQCNAAPKALVAKWAPEEIEDGMRGIRWVMPEGVFGRPTDHDVREYLLRTETACGCQCDDCKKFYAAPKALEPTP